MRDTQRLSPSRGTFSVAIDILGHLASRRLIDFLPVTLVLLISEQRHEPKLYENHPILNAFDPRAPSHKPSDMPLQCIHYRWSLSRHTRWYLSYSQSQSNVIMNPLLAWLWLLEIQVAVIYLPSLQSLSELAAQTVESLGWSISFVLSRIHLDPRWRQPAYNGMTSTKPFGNV